MRNLNFKNLVLLGSLIFSTTAFAFPSGSTAGKEVVVRFKTEKLQNKEKLNIIKSELEPLDLQARLEFFAEVLSVLPDQGLSQYEVDKLALEALDDLEKLTYVLSGSSRFYPINTYLQLLEWAVTDQVISAEIGERIIRSIKNFTWFNINDMHRLIGVMDNIPTDNKERFIKLFFDLATVKLVAIEPNTEEKSGRYLLYHISQASYCLDSCKHKLKKERRSYKDREQALLLLMKYKGFDQKMTTELRNLREELKLGRRAESGESLDSLMQVEENILHMGDILLDSIINKGPRSIYFQNSALIKYIAAAKAADMKTLKFYSSGEDRIGPITVLLNLPYVLQLSEEQLVDALAPLVRKSDPVGVFKNHHRFMVLIGAFSYEGSNKLHGMQKVFEALAESLDKEEDIERSSAADLLKQVQRCVKPKSSEYFEKRMPVCDYVTSPKAIFTKVSENPNVHVKLKQQARELAEAAPN